MNHQNFVGPQLPPGFAAMISTEADLSYPNSVGGGFEKLRLYEPHVTEFLVGTEVTIGNNRYVVVDRYYSEENLAKLVECARRMPKTRISLIQGKRVRQSNGIPVALGADFSVFLPANCPIMLSAGTKLQQLDAADSIQLELKTALGVRLVDSGSNLVINNDQDRANNLETVIQSINRQYGANLLNTILSSLK